MVHRESGAKLSILPHVARLHQLHNLAIKCSPNVIAIAVVANVSSNIAISVLVMPSTDQRGAATYSPAVCRWHRHARADDRLPDTAT
jgi:Ni/Fe-hydrogenase subunit HybB-like protein